MNAVTQTPAPHSPDAPPPPQGTSLTRWHMLVISLIAALVVFLVGTTLDYFLLHDEHDSRTTVVEVSDALGGLVTGALMFRLLQYERERRERLRHKLTVISDMNHHVATHSRSSHSTLIRMQTSSNSRPFATAWNGSSGR